MSSAAMPATTAAAQDARARSGSAASRQRHAQRRTPSWAAVRSTLDSPQMARRAYHRFCPLSMALEDVGDRWTLHIVYALLDGPKRYADLQHFIRGAGSNVLGDRLTRLAESGIIGRSTGDTPGSDTTYHLTERGFGLAPAIQGLVAWGFASLLPSGDDAKPETFDQTWAVP